MSVCFIQEEFQLILLKIFHTNEDKLIYDQYIFKCVAVQCTHFTTFILLYSVMLIQVCPLAVLQVLQHCRQLFEVNQSLSQMNPEFAVNCKEKAKINITTVSHYHEHKKIINKIISVPHLAHVNLTSCSFSCRYVVQFGNLCAVLQRLLRLCALHQFCFIFQKLYVLF